MTVQTRALPLLGMLAALAWAAPAHAQWELEIPLEEGVIHPQGAEVQPTAMDAPEALPADPGPEDPRSAALAEPEAGDDFARILEGAGARPTLAPAAAPTAPAAAQSGEPPPAGAGPDEAAAPTRRPTRLRSPTVGPEALVDHWDARRARLRDLDHLGAESEAEAVLAAARALAIPSLPRLAEAVLLEGRRALAAGDPREAAERAALAVRLAPDHPATHWFSARVALARTPPVAGDALAAGARAMAHELGTFPYARSNAVAAGFLVLSGAVLAGLVLVLGAALRSLRPFLHDLHHRMPAGSLPLQTWAVGLVLLLLPVALGLGLAVLLTALALASWAYLSHRERWVLVASVGVVLAAPAATGTLAGQLAFWNGPAADVWRLEHTGEWAAPRARLERLERAEAAPWEVRYALARASLRSGRWDEVAPLWEALVAERPRHPGARNNLGVVRFARGDLVGAAEAFESATRASPGLAAAWHNLARARYEAADLAGGGEATRRARELDGALVDAHPADAWELNRALATAALGADEIAAVAAAAPRRQGTVLARVLAGPLPPVTHPWLALGGLAVVAGGGSVLARRRRARRCEACGDTACERCLPEVAAQPLCGQCLTLTRDETRVPPEQRAAKHAQAVRHQRRRARLQRAVGLVLPGGLDLAQGRTLTGAGLVLLAGIATAGLLPGPLAPLPGRLGTWLPGSATVGAVLAALAWGLGGWRALRAGRKAG